VPLTPDFDFLITALYKIKERELWVGGRSKLVLLKNGLLKHYLIPDKIEETDVISILQSRDHEIWFGTRGDGLYKLIDDKINRDNIPAKLLTDGVNAFHQDSNGVIFIGTDNNGLFRYANGTYENFSGKNGLFSDRIFSILEDDSLNLWCSANKGVFSVSKHQLDDFAAHKIERLTCKIYNHLDGMREAECNGRRQPVACKDRDGKLWFASIAGAVCVDPNHLPMNKVKPPVYIEEINCADSSYRSQGNPLKLKSKNRDIEFKYTALSFTIPERVRFRYRLEGYDHDWIQAGTRRTAYYTNLKKGDYRFQVLACNNDDLWNSEGATIAFTIPPFWFETWWAYLGYIIAGAAVIRIVLRKRYERSLVAAQLKMQNEHAARLEELDAAKSRFFAGISHEFRTPLTLIKGPLKELLDQTTSSPKRTMLTIMYNNARRLERLVQELLDLAHLQSHSLKLELVPVDIFSFVKTIMASFESLAKQRRIELEFTVAEPVNKMLILIDPDKIEKVLLNLIFNAFKYTEENGKISVAIDPVAESGYILIKVSDTGKGIPPEIRPKIFDLFFRYQQNKSSFEPGAGIGLALSQELVQLHDGEITVTSTEGAGSEFVIRLPARKAEQIVESAPSCPPGYDQLQAMALSSWYDENLTRSGTSRSSKNKKAPQILLVEDNPELRYFVSRHLKNYYAILEATDGEMAFPLLAKNMPDLIISDIMMPRMDGLEFIKRVKRDQATSHIPVILVTARGSLDNKMDGLESGAVEYLIKPFEIKELLLKTRNLLEISQRQRERYRKAMASPVPEPAAAPAISLDDRFLQKAHTIILEHLGEAEFGPDHLAKLMAFSRPHLNRKLFALTGLRTNEFIRTMRLRRAAELLQARSGSVSEIAFQVGFEHLSYFAKTFKNQYGVLPSEYGA
jgi:signal transduction histidine kinase/DNA-binding response OmpR family regulator